MTTGSREGPNVARQAIEGIGIVTLGTVIVAALGWGLAALVNWVV